MNIKSDNDRAPVLREDFEESPCRISIAHHVFILAQASVYTAAAVEFHRHIVFQGYTGQALSGLLYGSVDLRIAPHCDIRMGNVIAQSVYARLFNAVDIFHQKITGADTVAAGTGKTDGMLSQNHIIQFLSVFCQLFPLVGIVFGFQTGKDIDLVFVLFLQRRNGLQVFRQFFIFHSFARQRFEIWRMVAETKGSDACFNGRKHVFFVFAFGVSASLRMCMPVCSDHFVSSPMKVLYRLIGRFDRMKEEVTDDG